LRSGPSKSAEHQDRDWPDYPLALVLNRLRLGHSLVGPSSFTTAANPDRRVAVTWLRSVANRTVYYIPKLALRGGEE
jgi:hypothetical protein